MEALRKAFDLAWARISRTIRRDRVTVDLARFTLAGIILALPQDGNFDPQRLADSAVRVMRCPHRELSHKRR